MQFTANGTKPEAPALSVDDTQNSIILLNGASYSNLEFSLDGGKTFAALTAESRFVGNKTVLVRVKAMGKNPPSDSVTLRFTNSTPNLTENLSLTVTSGNSLTISAP